MDNSQSVGAPSSPVDPAGSSASTLSPAAASALDLPDGRSSAITGDPPRFATTAMPSFETRATAAAEKFESFFIAQMLRQMRSGANQFADEDSAAKDPLNADMLSLADGLLADSLAGRHAFGIADAILRQLTPKADAIGPVERKPA